MADDAVWPADPHTLAKHEILKRYLEGWFPILGRKQGRLVYFDAFAGPGVYAGGEPGSPIVALTTLLNHSALPQLARCEFVFIFLEPRRDRFEILERQIAKVRAQYDIPNNIRIIPQQMKFDEGTGDILAVLAEQKSALAPTFAFIDPFGFGDTPLDLVCKLLDFPSCEVLFTFIFNHINWFIDKEAVAGHLEGLFGTGGFREASGKSGLARKEFLRDLFRKQLQSECGFEHITSFEMVNMQGNTIYFLFHGTRSLRGLEVMKEALWKADPGGGVKFMDRLAGQDVLFGGANLDTGPLRSALLAEFAGKEVSVAAIGRFVLVSTPYGKNHWKRVLRDLEDEGLLEATTPRSRRLTFPDGTRVRFFAP